MTYIVYKKYKSHGITVKLNPGILFKSNGIEICLMEWERFSYPNGKSKYTLYED